jgi:hypothetical protein
VLRVLVKISEGKSSLQDLSVDGDKIKWILKEQGVGSGRNFSD